MSENAQKAQKTAALQGAVFAFSPQDQLLSGPLKSNPNGARTAALVAASYQPRPSSTLLADSLAKHEDTSDLGVPRSSVENQVHKLERLDTGSKTNGSQPSGRDVRPGIARSSSHIAARLASTKNISNTKTEKRSTSLSPTIHNSGGGFGVDPNKSSSTRVFSRLRQQNYAESPVAPELSTESPQHTLSVTSIQATALSPQLGKAADIAARAMAMSKLDQQASSRWNPHQAAESPLPRRLSTSSARSDVSLLHSGKKQAPVLPQKPEPLRPRSKSQPRKSSRSPLPTPPRDLRTGLTTSALADAMVASSLASSRAPSPTKSSNAPPPPPRRQRHSRSYSQDPLHPRSRSLLSPFPPPQRQQHPFSNPASNLPSPRLPGTPTHTLRTTLRSHEASAASSDDDANNRRGSRRHLVRKHPHKHHEGLRQRWRPTITATERRRYEGVWAANRGLLMPSPPPLGEQVCNLVVRELWERSRLGAEVLGDIWDLVSKGRWGDERRRRRQQQQQEEEVATEGGREGGGEGRRSLGKIEFVVGMWLVDQSLKGRKLPAKVGNEVWESARGVEGVTVKGVG